MTSLTDDGADGGFVSLDDCWGLSRSLDFSRGRSRSRSRERSRDFRFSLPFLEKNCLDFHKNLNIFDFFKLLKFSRNFARNRQYLTVQSILVTYAFRFDSRSSLLSLLRLRLLDFSFRLFFFFSRSRSLLLSRDLFSRSDFLDFLRTGDSDRDRLLEDLLLVEKCKQIKICQISSKNSMVLTLNPCLTCTKCL